jgi:hypothetical protein
VSIFKPITLLFFLLFASYSYAAVTPGPAPQFDLKKIKIREVESLTGKKLTLFQKIKFKLLQKALVKPDKGEMTEKQQKQATASLILGTASIALLVLSLIPFIGFLGIFAIPAAILAIIFGAKSLNGNSNTRGIIGVVTGGLTLSLIILAVILLALILSSGFE